MLLAIIRDFGVSSVLCLGERVLERLLFPGLHRVSGRMATADPARADDLATLVAEALGLMALVWLFLLSLHAISYLSRRPLRPYATTLVATGIVLLIFVSSWAQWMTLPVRPS